ncbi:MAG: patatin-like phospholipase family protein [Acetobacteraceae bacterium]|nr:patatin-like phospholipase family protein [Acetobacteraceae bacterium]
MTKRETVNVDLALQGGGAHGAFTWGVLDRLLEEPWLEIEGISGTSAGAMNAAVMACGYARDGREGARQALEGFWRKVSKAARFSPFQRGPVDIMLGRWTLDNSPAFLMMDLMARMVSPYDVPSLGGNPLADVLADSLDFTALRNGPIKVFVTATNVRTGRARIFRNADLGVEALLASACLPQLFQAVEIEGDAYWDGGFAGNPTLVPLVTELESDDTILIPINPIDRPGMKELKMMALLRKVADPGDSEGAAWARMRLHMVRNDVMVELGYSSKLNAEWAFLEWLRDAGRKAGDAFLQDHAAAIGKHSSLDLDALLEGI